MNRGLCKELFGGKPYEQLSTEERRQYQNEWKRRNHGRVREQYTQRKDTLNAKRRQRKISDPEWAAERRAYERDWNKRNKHKHPDYYRRYRLKAEYGITQAQYEEMLEAQGGCCVLCGNDKSGNWYRNRLAVDHDHVTGRVRGLLCHQCNMMLGHSKDDADLLRRAAEYVERHRR